MYRVLLKSIDLVCSGWQGQGPRRSCREGPGTWTDWRKQNRNRTWRQP